MCIVSTYFLKYKSEHIVCNHQWSLMTFLINIILTFSTAIVCFSKVQGQDEMVKYWSGGKAKKYNVGCIYYGENLLFLKKDSSFSMKRISFQFKSDFKQRDKEVIEEQTELLKGQYSIHGAKLELTMEKDSIPHWIFRIVEDKLISYPNESLKNARKKRDMIWKKSKSSNFKFE